MNQFEKIIQRAKALQPETIAWRRDFHQYPEVAFQEFKTAQKVAEVLKGLGMEIKMLVNSTGVRGFLRGSKPGKNIALRADIDALPIQEEAGVPYKSRNPGVMHACGHDAHTAMLLAAATILAEWKKDLAGNVTFLFQPAEETGGGANKMVEEGFLEGVNRIFRLHVYSSLGFGVGPSGMGPVLSWRPAISSM